MAFERNWFPAVGASIGTPATTFLRHGFVTGITTPKSTIFFVAVLPQFVVPANGLGPLQMLLRSGVFLLAGILSMVALLPS